MVLRGSKTAPDDSLQVAIHNLNHAKQREVEANQQLQRYNDIHISNNNTNF